MTRKPNFVLIFSDQQRADTLACYGNRFTETPGVDRLATGGARFSQAFTPWPVCTPARASVWTGVYPHKHALTENVYGVENAFESVSKVKRTLFDELRGTGYLTAHFGKWHLGEKKPAFFDIYVESFNSLVSHWVDGLVDGTYRPNLQTDLCIEFLHGRKAGDKPFVLVQSYYPPHDPFTAPKAFYAPYRGKGIPFAGYYAAVSALAADTGRILDALDETGLVENTVVMYFSDHGETFWYRQDGEHKFVCHDDSIQIPILIRWPGRITPGTVINAPVGLQDLMPTILDMAGVAMPHGLHGNSLMPLLRGDAQGWRDCFYVETITAKRRVEQRCVRTRRWKLIADAKGEHEFYDLETDPEEELNIFLTPRMDTFEMFKHMPSFAKEIANLAGRMRGIAAEFDDSLGIEMADLVLSAIKERLHS